MMKKIILSFVAFFTIVSAIAHGLGGDHHHDVNPNITPYNDAADAKAGISTAYLLKRSAWKAFTQKYPSWGARFDRFTEMPHRAFGEPISFAPGGSDPELKARLFLQTEMQGFQIPVQELVTTRQVNDGKYIHVDFKQVHQGKEVMWSRVTVRFSQDLRILLVGIDAHKNIPTLNPTLTASQAISAAEAALTTPIIRSNVEPDMKIFPLPTEEGNYSFRPVYIVYVETQDDITTPGNYMNVVDAINGNVLYRENKVLNIGFEVKANIYPTNLFAPPADLPLKNLRFSVGGTNYFTDINGNANVPGAGPINATLELRGSFIRVVTGANGNTSATLVKNGINNNDVVQFDASEPNASIRHLTCYYHGNEIHDYMKSKMPAFTTMDNPLLTRVDRTDGNCNAFYNGNSINFYTTANGCNALSVVNTVVYHEYGHGITNQFWSSQGTTFNNGGMGEGYSDVWAMSLNKNPIVGQGFNVNAPNSFIRRYDQNPKKYPDNLVGQVHADGEIIAGAWWSYMTNLMATLTFEQAVEQMNDLFAASHYGLANGANGTEGKVYYDILIDALQYDDDNNNINDGTPHFMQIVQAFAKHGIYLLSTAELNHTPPGIVNSGTTISLDASALVDFPAFLGDVKVFYRLRGTTPFDSLTMTKTGTDFAVNFPNSTQGNVYEYIFAIYDNASTLSNYSPGKAQFGLSVSFRNIPHYLIIGYKSMYLENFDNITPTTPGWIIGDAPGDNATAGKWIVAVPVPSSTNGEIVQTGQDHTAVGPSQGKCAVTANAPLPTSAVGNADVDGGRTSLVTQEFDLSPYTQPLISYWRWYTNSQGTNPGKDQWRVYASYNNGASWTLIERTFVPDVSWRRYVWQPNLANGNRVRLMFVATDSAQGAATGSIVEAAVDDFQILDLGNSVGIEETALLYAHIYPNPAKDMLYISSPEHGVMRYQVTNTVGATILSGTAISISGQQIQLPLKDVAEGLYFVKLEIGHKKSTHKVLISR